MYIRINKLCFNDGKKKLIILLFDIIIYYNVTYIIITHNWYLSFFSFSVQFKYLDIRKLDVFFTITL